jgi:hypothetical protein
MVECVVPVHETHAAPFSLGPRRGAYAPFAFSTVNRRCVARFYGRAGRSVAKQRPSSARAVLDNALLGADGALFALIDWEVRTAPSAHRP